MAFFEPLKKPVSPVKEQRYGFNPYTKKTACRIRCFLPLKSFIDNGLQKNIVGSQVFSCNKSSHSGIFVPELGLIEMLTGIRPLEVAGCLIAGCGESKKF